MAQLDELAWFRCPLLLAEAKGVAGLGKAGGDGHGGADNVGQQVPPEVYMALTYAGTLFLFTLSVPLILYGLNKLLNKIEQCFGCGSSSKESKLDQGQQKQDIAQQKESTLMPSAAIFIQQPAKLASSNNNYINSNHNDSNYKIPNNEPGRFHPNNTTRHQLQHNQRLNLQLLQQQPKYAQFTSVSNDNTSLDMDHQQAPLVDVNRH